MKFLKLQKLFVVFVLLYLTLMFLPRLLGEGMFFDGLTYTAIGRNMAIGKGSFWQPYFSSAIWLQTTADNTFQFYGHPPLGMWLMSLFFRCLGTAWWVDKVYCVVVWVANIIAFRWVWQVFANIFDTSKRSFWWLGLFCWYIQPTILWAYPNALLDNLLSFFCLLGVGFLLQYQYKKHLFYVIGATIVIFLGFLAKGPVALFPLCVPFWWAILVDKKVWKGILQSLLFTLVLLVLFLLLFWVEPLSLHFFQQYFRQQIAGSLVHFDELQRTKIQFLGTFLLEIMPLLGMVLIFYCWARIKKVSLFGVKNDSFLLIAIFFSGSLPILISQKMTMMYAIPALSFSAMAMAWYLVPIVEKWEISEKGKSIFMAFNALLFIVLIAVSYLKIGTIGRDRAILELMTEMKQQYQIPDNTLISTNKKGFRNGTLHAYLQRYHGWELTADRQKSPIYIWDVGGELRLFTSSTLHNLQ